MRGVLFVPLLALCGCEIAPEEVARQCDIDQANFDATFEAVDRLAAGQARNAGSCTFKKVTGSERVVVVITKTGGGIFPVSRD